MILAIFDLQVILILSTQLRVNWPVGSGEVQCRFSRRLLWRPFWISDQNDLFIYLFHFYLQITMIFPTKFQVNWPFGLRAGGSK